MKITRAAIPNLQANHEELWAALVSRKEEAETAFVYGVTTTGVFCRPNCRSRLPKPENVRFFSSSAEALSAGFRPCKRCQPDREPPRAELEDRIARACRLLEQANEAVALPTLAKSVGMSSFHFQRLFKARLGITPKQYQSARRLDRFRRELRQRSSVTDALYEAGFRSSSRAYERVSGELGMSPRQYKTGGKGVIIRFCVENTSLGWVLIAATNKGVCAIEIGEEADEVRQRLTATFPNAELQEVPEALAEYVEKVRQYLASPNCGLSLSLDLGGTAFQRRVWEALQKIPPGQTATYQEIARRIGAPQAVRAVASACAANVVALAIPCHRAIRTDGGLGGYRWRLERKRLLLEGEQGVLPGSPAKERQESR